MSLIADVNSSEHNVPRTGWQLFRQLVSGELAPGLAWKNPRHRRKFLLRSLATPFSTARLLNTLVNNPRLPEMLHVQPGLPCRLHRPWLSLNVTKQAAIDGLQWHYAMMAKTLPAAVFNRYLSKPGCTLASLTGREDRRFSVRLVADAMLDKEGEATLLFCNAENTVLAELTFTLCPVAGVPVLYIGGLQGAKAHVDHAQIQQATKACHGLFPKRLLVEVLMTLGQHLGVGAIRAVSNDTHIYRSVRYRKKKQGQLHADYSNFWASLGGEQAPDGDYLLPLAMPRKPMEEIASKKRAEYRRRYELLDGLHAQALQTCQR